MSFTDKYGQWAVIAGASDGIGLAFAEKLAAEGMNLILLARRESLLNEIAARIENAYDVQVKPIKLDLTSPDMRDSLESISNEFEVGMLVYNAGVNHEMGLFLDRPLDEALTCVSLNCEGVVTAGHIFASQMVERQKGAIILLSSGAGEAGSAYQATYSAAKGFVTRFAESMWQELHIRGLHVMGLIAGATNTPSVQHLGLNKDGIISEDGLMDPPEVAEYAIERLGKDVICVPGDHNREGLEMLRAMSRQEASDGITMGTAAMYNLPFPLEA